MFLESAIQAVPRRSEVFVNTRRVRAALGVPITRLIGRSWFFSRGEKNYIFGKTSIFNTNSLGFLTRKPIPQVLSENARRRCVHGRLYPSCLSRGRNRSNHDKYPKSTSIGSTPR
uniref:Uncharacterized protein n=1 Tax=Sipha flava TaxID=143950 RepID=A0A2S2QZ44_9HEMI